MLVRGDGTFAVTLKSVQKLSEFGLGPRSTLCFTPSAINHDELAGVVALLPRCGERNFWVGTEGEHLLLAIELVAEAPELAPRWLDEQVQTVAVRQLVRLVPRPGFLNSEVVEQHG